MHYIDADNQLVLSDGFFLPSLELLSPKIRAVDIYDEGFAQSAAGV